MADANAALMEAEPPVPGNAVAPRQSDALALPATQSGALLDMLRSVMLNPTLSMERINQTFDFYQRVEQAAAKKAFDAAMAAAKAEFEPIIKRHKVDQGAGKANYKHEDLFDIAEAITPALSKYGLSYRYRATSKINEPITVTCVITHEAGYSEETTLSAGRDDSGGKNPLHAMASTLSYLQRYTLRLGAGVAAGRDNDGNTAAAAPPEVITDIQRQDLQLKIVEANADIEKFCIAFKISSIADLPAGRLAEALGLLSAKKAKAVKKEG